MSIRECGDSRTDGGVYIDGPDYGPGGAPVEDFLIDPPRVIDLERHGIIPRGQHLIEFDGVHHIADIIGESNYPYPWDYVREVAYGSRPSRKTSLRPEQLALLTPESRLVLLHRRAMLDNRADLVSLLHDGTDRRLAQQIAETEDADADAYTALGWDDFACPQSQDVHKAAQLDGWLSDPERRADALPCCIGLWRFAVDVPGVTYANKKGTDERIYQTEEVGDGWHVIRRKLACGARWVGYGHADFVPQWSYAIFAVFPITGISVVDPKGQHAEKLAQLHAKGVKQAERVDE